MPCLDLKVWDSIRSSYETGSPPTDLARTHGVSYEAVRKRAKAEGWLNPRVVTRKAKTNLLSSLQDRESEAVERLVHLHEQANQDLGEAASQAIRKFREEVEEGKHGVRSWKELQEASSLLDKAAGKDERAGPKIGLNLQLLASPAPEIIEI